MALGIVTLAFVMMMVWTHVQPPVVERLRTPLSLLRDGAHPVLGFVLFGLLILIHVLLIHKAWRARAGSAVAVFALATALIVFVTATSSSDGAHLVAAVLALSVPYSYYAVKMKLEGSGWLFPHLLAPLVLLLVTLMVDPGGSVPVTVRVQDATVWVPPYYGIWQKLIVLYFLLVANLHGLALPAVTPAAGDAGRLRPKRRVYALEAGDGWRRPPLNT